MTFKEHIAKIFEELCRFKQSTYAIELDLTGNCQNSCWYCGAYDKENNVEIEFSLLKKFMEQFNAYLMKKNMTLSLSLCGGDPVLYSSFYQLISFLHETGIEFILKTNPSSLHDENVSYLKEKGCCMIQFTLFGDEKCHNKYRGKDTTSVLKETTRLVKNFEIPVCWNLTVGKINLEATINALPFILEAKPDFVSIRRIVKRGRLYGKKNFEDINPSEYRDFLLKMLSFYYDVNNDNDFKISFAKENLWFPFWCDEGILDISKYEGSEDMSFGCSAYCRLISITREGDIVPCTILPEFKIASVYDETYDFDKIVNNHILSVEKPSACHSCRYTKFCQGCRAMAFYNTGDLYNKDPQCWVA